MRKYIVTNQKAACEGLVENYEFTNKRKAEQKARELKKLQGVCTSITVYDDAGHFVGSY